MKLRKIGALAACMALIMAMSFGCATTQKAAAPAKVEVADADSYVGSYEVAPGVALEVSTAGGDLYLQAPGQQKIALVAEADGTFSIPMATTSRPSAAPRVGFASQSRRTPLCRNPERRSSGRPWRARRASSARRGR